MAKVGAWKNGIRREANGTYTATWYEQGKKRWKRGLPDRETAKRYKADREAERRPDLDKAKPETADALAARYSRDFCSHKARTTQAWYVERLSKFGEDFKGRQLSKITRQEAFDWGLENTDRVKAVRAMYADAVKLGIDGLRDNPFSRLTLRRSKGRAGDNVIPLTVKELERLKQIAAEKFDNYGHHVAALIEVAAGTGMRPGELFALEWDDIDWERGEIHVRRSFRSKTGELVDHAKTDAGTRHVPVLPGTAIALRSIEKRAGHVFYSPHGKRMQQHHLNYHWGRVRDAFTDKLPSDHWLRRRMAKKGSQGNLDFYELRHRFGTELAKRGASPYVIARLMGHRDGGKLAMATYIHIEDHDAVDAAHLLFAEPQEATG